MKLGEVGSRGQHVASGEGQVSGPNVAVIGCGAVCEKHLTILRELPRARVIGLCDRDREAALRMAKHFRIEAVYDDVDELLDGTRPDVVHVLTPPATHARLAIQAMEAGAHVLVEKPMASDVREAEAMIATALRCGVKLCVSHNFLFESSILKARELVERGAVGRLVAVEIYWRVLSRRFRHIGWIHELPGGVFHEVAPHPVYLMGAFLGNLRVVSAVTSDAGDELGPDELRVHFASESGLGTLAVSTSARPHQIWLRIYGTRSTLILDSTTDTLIRLRPGNESRIHKLLRNLDYGMQLSLGTAASAVRYLSGRTATGHARLIEAFYASLESDGQPPVSGQEGRDTVAVLQEIWEALER